MLGSPSALRKQTELYNLGIKLQVQPQRKIPLGRNLPVVLEKGAKKSKQGRRRQQRDAREDEGDEAKSREQTEEQNRSRQQETSYNSEGEIKHRIEETILTLQRQESAFRELDVSAFSRSQTAAWREALATLNERTAEMMREVEVRCSENQMVAVGEGTTEQDAQGRDEEGKEKRKKKDKMSKKRNRAHYDSRGWRVQSQPKAASLQKSQSLSALKESSGTQALQKRRSKALPHAKIQVEEQEASPMQDVRPSPPPPMQRVLPPARSATQSCPALHGRPPAMPPRPPAMPSRPAPQDSVELLGVDQPSRPAPLERVRLKPLKSSAPLSPLLSLLADPDRRSTTQAVVSRSATPLSQRPEAPKIETPSRPVSTSTAHSCASAAPRHQRLLTSEVRAQRALGKLKSLQNLLSSKAQSESGDPALGTNSEPSSPAHRNATVVEHSPQNSVRGPSSVSCTSPSHGVSGAASPGTSPTQRVRFSVIDEAVAISPRVTGNAAPSKRSSMRRQSLLKVAEAVARAQEAASAEKEEHLAWEKRRKYMSEVFHKMQDESDHEIHRDNVPKALELIGFSNPDMTWVAEVFDGLTCYNTLNEDEFLSFVESYGARQDRAGAELFKEYDADASGTIDVDELANLLGRFGITPMAKVIEDTVSEVAEDDSSEGPPTDLTLTQTKRLMDILRVREGFTLDKYTTFIETFHRYNRNHSGEMKTQEVLGALGFLGYTSDPESVESVCSEVDVDGTGTINEREFIVLMRKVHEREIAQAQEVFQQKIASSPHGRFEIHEVQELLKTLGYMTSKLAIIEAAEDAGIERLQDHEIAFEDFYQTLEVFREREGFTRAEAKNIKAAFDAQDLDKDGELTHLELGKALRQLGYVASCNMQQKLVAEVDIDGSGSIDMHEMMKLIRKFNEWENQKSRNEFKKEVALSNGTTGELQDKPRVCTLTGRQTRRAMTRLGVRESGSSSSSESDADDDSNPKKLSKIARKRWTVLASKSGCEKDKKYDVWAFIAMCSRLNFKRHAFMRETCGIPPDELKRLRACFDEYDKDGSGEISDRELRSVLENLFPQLATSQECRPHLVKIIEKADSDRSGTLDFDDFVRLVNQCHDLREKERLQKEQKAILDSGFAPEEVQGFRELFMGDSERVLLSFDNLKEMMSSIVPLGHKNSLELEAVFKSLASETDAGLRSDFPEYLRIMRQLLDTNFAGLEEHARRANCQT